MTTEQGSAQPGTGSRPVKLACRNVWKLFGANAANFIRERDGKASMADVTEAHEAVLGKMMVLGSRLMREHGVTNGFRNIINTGADGGQEVYHLHMHVIGGPRPWAKG